MGRGRTETTPSTRKKPGQRSDNEAKSKSSSSRKETTKQRIEKAKNALMSSNEDNDDVEVGVGKTTVAAPPAKKNNNIAVIQAKNKELEAEIKVLNEKDKDWEALNADNVGVISELRERVATLNMIVSNLEADVRVAQGSTQALWRTALRQQSGIWAGSSQALWHGMAWRGMAWHGTAGKLPWHDSMTWQAVAWHDSAWHSRRDAD
eukprot:scaffold133765_cov60-Attheya_sp.AAC.7